MRQVKGMILVISAAICWGLTGSLFILAPRGASPVDFGVIRLMIGGGFLLGYGLVKERERVRLTNTFDILRAAIAIGLYQPFFFMGVSRIGIASGTVVAIGSAPILAGGFAIYKKKTVSVTWCLGTIASVVGLVMMFLCDGIATIDFIGYGYALLAGLMYVLYVEYSKPVYLKTDKVLANGVIFSLAGLLMSPLLWSSDLGWVVSRSGVTSIVLVGLLATSLPYLLYSYGITSIENHVGVVLTLFEPLTATLLGLLVFNETLMPIGYYGIVVMGMGLLVSCLPTEFGKGRRIGYIRRKSS